MSTQLTIVENNRGWTLEQDNFLLSKIKETPNNIRYACHIVATELNKQESTVQSRWYMVLKHREENNIITLSSDKGYVNNIKNTPRPEESSDFEVVLEKMSKLTRRQAKIIFDIFNR